MSLCPLCVKCVLSVRVEYLQHLQMAAGETAHLRLESRTSCMTVLITVLMPTLEKILAML